MTTAEIPTRGKVAYYVLDFAWHFVDVSATAERCLFHRPAHELLGRILWQEFPELVDTALYHNLQQAAEQHRAVQFEMVSPEDGTWFEVQAYPWPDRLEVFQQDITHHKQAVAELQSIARFPDENPNPVLRIGADGIVQYANVASQSLLMQWGCAVGQPIPEMWRTLVADVLEIGQNHIAEVASADRILSLHLVPIVEAGYVNIYASDVTSRTQAEAGLKRNEERATLLQELTAALAAPLTTQEVADTIVNTISRSVGAQFGIVAILDDDAQALQILNTSPTARSLAEPFRHLPLTASLPLTDAIRTKQQIWIRNFEDYRRHYPGLAGSVQTQTQTQAMVALPMYVQDRIIGGVGFSFLQPQVFSDEDQTLFIAVAQQCAQAIERAQLYQQAQELAAMQERERLARDLHDAVSQSLFSASLIAGTLLRQTDAIPAKWQVHLEQLQRLIRGALAEMRTLLLELRPTALLDADLGSLLEQLVLAAQTRKILTVSSEVDSGLTLPAEVKLAFYRIAQESLNNLTKYSQATDVRIFYGLKNGAVELRIEDNGRGFDITTVPSTSLGLNIMRERAEGVRASLQIRSQVGAGTAIAVTWIDPNR